MERDDGMLFIGPQAERRFGMRHFMGLMAVFTAPPEFTVLHGREEIGRVDPVLLVDRVEGPRLLLLAGRSWRVTWTDWKRRRCFVEPFADGGGRARWLSSGVGGLSFEIARAMRDVLLGSAPPVTLTRRADGILAGLRSDALGRVAPGRTLISGTDDEPAGGPGPATGQRDPAGNPVRRGGGLGGPGTRPLHPPAARPARLHLARRGPRTGCPQIAWPCPR